MTDYFTVGQTAKKLKVSVSTIKRWVGELKFKISKNYLNWWLFSEEGINKLKNRRKSLKKKI